MRRGKRSTININNNEKEIFFRWSNIHIHSYYHNPDGTWNIKLVDDLHASKWKKKELFSSSEYHYTVDISQTFLNWINRTWIFAMRAMDILPEIYSEIEKNLIDGLTQQERLMNWKKNC